MPHPPPTLPEPLPAPPSSVHPLESTSDHDPALAPVTNDSLAYVFRHSSWRTLRAHTHAALNHLYRQALISDSRLDAFERCGRRAWIRKHRTEPDRYKFILDCCHDRFCVPCANARATIIRENLTRNLHDTPHRFLTLTLAHSIMPLAAQITRLLKCFGRLRHRTFWKERVTGGAAFFELTWNKHSNTWHPHLHAILQGTFLPHAMLKAAWLDITGDSFVVDIRLIRRRQHAIAYLAKYATKPIGHTVNTDTFTLSQAIMALAGRKLVYSFGTWARWKLLQRPNDDEWVHFSHLNGCLHGLGPNPELNSQIQAAWHAFAIDGGPAEFTARSPPPIEH